MNQTMNKSIHATSNSKKIKMMNKIQTYSLIFYINFKFL